MLNHSLAAVAVWTEKGRVDSAADVELVAVAEDRTRIVLHAAPVSAICWVAVTWNVKTPERLRILGDHWERAYGDLEWRGIVPERALPWYALVHDDDTGSTAGFGIETGAATLASWRVDKNKVTLVLDVRCGGRGVLLGDRPLVAATVLHLNSIDSETPFHFAQRFCKSLCKEPILPPKPVYGGNDWYFRYGQNSAETVLRDSGLIRELSPSGDNEPTFVIDAGWSPGVCEGGPYTRGTELFPDMRDMAERLVGMGIKPGIWIRPLLTNEPLPTSWRLPKEHAHGNSSAVYLDPSVPEVLEHVSNDIVRLCDWGFTTIKHDFTTYDVTGCWGFEMGSEFTAHGWTFADRCKTTAEILTNLYNVIRKAAGESTIIGCNTVGHLAAGLFELQRTGDDTSGRHWERTRKMGINTLAFRMPQHGALFAADADCVGITREIDWSINKQWLDVLSRSGTPLFVSADPEVIGCEQRAALREAFSRAAVPREPSEPLDWLHSTCPQIWRCHDGAHEYDWHSFPGAVFRTPA